MTTEEIAKALKLTSQLMELHEENPFKIKSIANAAFKLDKTDIDLNGKTLEELENIEGVGKGIAAKIHEIQATGNLKELEHLVKETPLGVIEMLSIKGIGPKKIRQLWKELDIESIGELLYACNENRLITLKGFGAKTQSEIKKQIEFFQSNSGKFHYASVEKFALDLVEELKKEYQTEFVSLTGEMRRKCEIIEKVEVVIGTDKKIKEFEKSVEVKVEIIQCSPADFYKTLFNSTGSEDFRSHEFKYPELLENEEAIFKHNHLQFIEPELRENIQILNLAERNAIPELVCFEDLKGILHNHSTYSDGLNSLKDMALYCQELGYEYLGICDHSQSAFYANGLKPERVVEQHKEIDELNKKMHPFKILKGIESDILNDGSLDYENSILETFDFVVASIHSNLKMDEEKANSRLIKAIENPYTSILGHPTGRLLLSRRGYPIDHKKIIDACAANNVVIELNAHPYRLDIDWRWIPYCIEKGVKISINPDAHEKSGYYDMYYGVCVARKGMLTKNMCLNSMSLNEIENFFRSKR